MSIDVTLVALEEGLKFAFAAAVGYAIAYRRKKHSKELLQGGKRTECTATIDQTSYTQTTVPVAGDNEEFYIDQDISSCDNEVSLSSFIPNDVQQRVMSYLKEARKHCTTASPLMYEHLRSVTPPDEYDRVIDTLNRGIIRYLSGKYNRPGSGQDRTAFLPVLVGEPYAPLNEFRIVLLTEDQTDFHRLPKRELLRYPVFDRFRKHFISDQNHPHADRIDLHRGICVGLANPHNNNLFAARVDLDITRNSLTFGPAPTTP